jgi:hypothetical protein
MKEVRNSGRRPGDHYDFMDVGFDPSVVIYYSQTNLAKKIFQISVSSVEQNKQDAGIISGNS